MEPTRVCPKDFHATLKKLRGFFEEKGWVEVKSKPKPKSKKVEEKDNG